jgi:hypothetical protein
MIKVAISDLKAFKQNPQHDRRLAINWLIERYGPHGDRWTLKNLEEIEFRKDRDATLFLLHWS